MFNDLLKSIGFKTRIISAKVITDAGEPGPEFDHLALIVELDEEYLADVGFGDLFIEPVAIKPGVQFDGRNYFKIVKEDPEYAVYMSPDGEQYARKYTFTKDEVSVSSFEPACHYKQTSPDSHFVKNTMCTQLTESGRITVYNEKFIETTGDRKTQHVIRDEQELKEILKTRFGITIGDR